MLSAALPVLLGIFGCIFLLFLLVVGVASIFEKLFGVDQ